MSSAASWSFFVDENLTKSLVKALRAAGYPAVRAVEAGFRAQPDTTIFRFACLRQWTIITRDKDYLNSAQYPPPHPGILVVRLPKEIPIPEIVRVVLDGLTALAGQDLSNHVYELRLDGVHQLS